MPEYIPSVGMEVHAELSTRSKMFCRCEVAFGGEPNTRVCPICLGMPGTLPVPNRAAVEMVLRTALALNCKIAMKSVFHRKNYFYPDLPKGYQVSQYGETNPLGYHGWIEIAAAKGGTKRIHIRRVHLEEDTGKLMHLPSGGSGVDYNRAGVPLMEIVTGFNPETGKPDISDPEEAKEYLVQLRQILLYLGVCDGKMEEGSLRCEPNISVRPADSDHLGTKTELKNLNSFRSVQLGVAYEVNRQVAAIATGEPIRQETRGWNEGREESFVMRVKETEQDYRYFPDPDLVPMCFEEDQVEKLKRTLPELPFAKSTRYQKDFGLNPKESAELVDDKSWAEYFEDGVKLGADPKQFFNFMRSELAMRLNADGISARQSKVTPGHIVDLLTVLNRKTINGKQAKEVFATMYEDGRMPSRIVAESGASQLTDKESVSPLVKEVLKTYPNEVARYKSGQLGVKGFLVGQVMRLSKGRANPELVQTLLTEELDGAS